MRTIKLISALFFLITSICAFSVELAKRSPGDNIWTGCKNISYAGISLNNACISLTEGDDCSLDVTFTVSGTQVLSQNMDLSVVPEICGSYAGCDYCLTIGQNPNDHSQRCVTVAPTCGVFQLPVVNAGCFPDSALASLIACQQNKCPNNCNGHGTCNSGVCTCNTGFYGEDCNSTGELFHQCQRIDQVGADICVRVKFDSCSLTVEIVLEGNGQEMTLFSNSYPVDTFKQVFQDGQCVDTGVCRLCLKWDNLILTEIEAHGCGSLELTCLGVKYPYTLGCFTDNEVVPQCFGSCPKNCSYNGYCYRGLCQCENDWDGSDCSIPKEYCPHYCSGHGTCNKENGVCACDKGYTGLDCSFVNPDSSSSNAPTGGRSVTVVVILVPLGVVAAVGLIGVGIWYMRKQRKNNGAQFHQLDLLEEDQEGLMEEMDG